MTRKNLCFSIASLLLGAGALFWFMPRGENPLVVISTGKGWQVGSMAYAPDSKALAVGVSTRTRVGIYRPMKGEVQVWDAPSGRLLQTLPADYGATVAFSPDGQTLAIGGESIRLWDRRKGRWKPFSKGTPRGNWVTYAPDGKTLATGVDDNTVENVKLWDAETGRLRHALKGHEGLALAGAFSPDSKRLATAGYDNTVKVWDAGTGALKRTLAGRTGQYMQSVAFAPDGKTIAGGDGGEVRLWDAQTGRLLRAITPGNSVSSVAFSPDGQIIANAGTYFHRFIGLGRASGGRRQWPKLRATVGEVRLWDAKTGRAVRKFSSGRLARSMVFAPDGRTLAQVSDDDTISIWAVK